MRSLKCLKLFFTAPHSFYTQLGALGSNTNKADWCLSPQMTKTGPCDITLKRLYLLFKSANHPAALRVVGQEIQSCASAARRKSAFISYS